MYLDHTFGLKTFAERILRTLT